MIIFLNLKFLSLHSLKNEIASTVEFLSTMGYTNPAEDVSKTSGATKQDTELFSTIFKQLSGTDGKIYICSFLNYLSCEVFFFLGQDGLFMSDPVSSNLFQKCLSLFLI